MLQVLPWLFKCGKCYDNEQQRLRMWRYQDTHSKIKEREEKYKQGKRDKARGESLLEKREKERLYNNFLSLSQPQGA